MRVRALVRVCACVCARACVCVFVCVCVCVYAPACVHVSKFENGGIFWFLWSYSSKTCENRLKYIFFIIIRDQRLLIALYSTLMFFKSKYLIRFDSAHAHASNSG